MKTVLRNGIPIGLFVLMALPATGPLQAQPLAPDLNATFVVIDAPGAGVGPGAPSCFGTIACPGTVGKRINALGEVVGFSLDDTGVYHGFVRDPFGHSTAFDVPGAGSQIGALQGTLAFSVNIEGTSAGYFIASDYVAHGFVRERDGKLLTFDVPGAGTGPGQGTFPTAINIEGDVAGYVLDSAYVYHGFVRKQVEGKVTKFEAPGAGILAFQGTLVADNGAGLDDTGTAVGWLFDQSNIVHGYVRAREGSITLVEFPDAGTTSPGAGSYVATRNLSGEIAGISIDDGFELRGALGVGGHFLTFEAPGAGTGGGGQGTADIAVNDFGFSTGYLSGKDGVFHCYVRDPWGHVAVFDPPGSGTLANQGSEPQSINFWGAIAGYFTDDNWVNHGFIRYP